MTTPRKDTSSELVELIRCMADSPPDGRSLEELADALNWPRDRVNERICQLGSRVSHAKVRVKHARVIKYSLKP